MRALRTLVLASVLTVLAGCATPAMKQMGTTIHAEHAVAKAGLEDIQQRPEAYFQKVDALWIGGTTPIQITKGEVEPKALDVEVVYQRQYPVTLQMVAQWIGTTTGVPVVVSADAVVSASETAYDPLRQLVQRADAQSGRQEQSVGGAPNGAGAGAFVIQYQGTLRGLLNEAAARTGNAWLWRNGRVVILNMDTRVFQLHALPGSSKVQATVSNQSAGGAQGGGGGGGGGGGSVSQTVNSGQTTTVETTVESFDTVAKTITSMLSPKGKVTAAGATGSVAVTDVPSVLDRVATYIEALNHQLTRQVVVDVRVYSVDITNTESYGINWQLVWESVGGMYRVNTNIGGTTAPGAGSLSLGVIDNGFTYGGSQVLLKALSQQGNVSIKTSAAVATLSNQPVPVQVAEETSYLAQSQTNLVANAGSSTTLTPGTVVTGFSMNLLPIILDENEILLQLQINLSSLRGIRQITSGGSVIEVPDVDARQFLQRVKLASGSTLVMGGFEQESVTTDDQGVGNSHWTLFGGSRNGVRKHTVMVVTLSPKVVD